MKITRTIVIDGKSKAEYDAIKAHLEAQAAQQPGWQLVPEPLVNRMTAIKVEEVDKLP